MAGVFRAIRELQDQIEAAGKGEIDAQVLLDLLQRVAPVGGTMTLDEPDPANRPSFVIGGGFARLDIFAQSLDTQGIKDGLDDATDPGAYWFVSNVAAGDFNLIANFKIACSKAGDYEFRFERVTQGGQVLTSPFRATVTIAQDDDECEVTLLGTFKNMGIRGEGEPADDILRRMQIGVNGPNVATITGIRGGFQVIG